MNPPVLRVCVLVACAVLTVGGQSEAQSTNLILAADREQTIHVPPGTLAVGAKPKTSLNTGFQQVRAEFPGRMAPRREKLQIAGVSPSTATVVQYDKLELSVDLRGTWDNPCDSDDVALDALVTTTSGKQRKQPGFFMVDQKREVRDGTEVTTPVGNGRWVVRLAPTEPGPLRCRLIARDRSGTVSKDAGPFTVRPGTSRGFVRQSKCDPHYLQFDNGDGFFPIGHNLPIYHTSGQLADEAIRKMASKGENYNRWWLSSRGLGIEWEKKLGWYRQAEAARLNRLLDLARQLDFYYMLRMDTHRDFRENGWKANPFNKINGGPCATVSDWFTNEEARPPTGSGCAIRSLAGPTRRTCCAGSSATSSKAGPASAQSGKHRQGLDARLAIRVYRLPGDRSAQSAGRRHPFAGDGRPVGPEPPEHVVQSSPRRGVERRARGASAPRPPDARRFPARSLPGPMVMMLVVGFATPVCGADLDSLRESVRWLGTERLRGTLFHDPIIEPLRPLLVEPAAPAGRAQEPTAIVLRGWHHLVVLPDANDEIAFDLKDIPGESHFQGSIYAVFDPAGKQVAEGVVASGETKAVRVRVVAPGPNIILLNSGPASSNAVAVTVHNRHWAIDSRPRKVYTRSPLRKEYWERIFLRRGRAVAHLARDNPYVVGFGLDPEMYQCWLYGHYMLSGTCFCDHCLGGFFEAKDLDRAVLAEKTTGKQRYEWLKEQKLMPGYYDYLADRMAELAAWCRDELHEIDPDLLLNMFVIEIGNWFCEGIARGFSEPDLPVVNFCEHTYYSVGYDRAWLDATHERYRAWNANVLQGSALWDLHFPPTRAGFLAAHAYNLAVHDESWWYWPGDQLYRDYGSRYAYLNQPAYFEQYWDACVWANREVAATMADPERRSPLETTEVVPWKGKIKHGVPETPAEVVRRQQEPSLPLRVAAPTTLYFTVPERAERFDLLVQARDDDNAAQVTICDPKGDQRAEWRGELDAPETQTVTIAEPGTWSIQVAAWRGKPLRDVGLRFENLPTLLSHDAGSLLVPATKKPGLIGHWPMDEGRGTVVTDTSGPPADNGTLHDATWAEGKAGTCLQFNGHSGQVLIPADYSYHNLKQFTLSAWVKLTDLPVKGNGHTIVNKGPEAPVQHSWWWIGYPPNYPLVGSSGYSVAVLPSPR